MLITAWQEAVPASLVALQVYAPLSEALDALIHSTATLLLKVTSQLLELKISWSPLYQVTASGCDPDTRASSLTTLPVVSSMCSEGFLVKLGGIFRSENKTYVKISSHTHTVIYTFMQWVENVKCFRKIQKEHMSDLIIIMTGTQPWVYPVCLQNSLTLATVQTRYR